MHKRLVKEEYLNMEGDDINLLEDSEMASSLINDLPNEGYGPSTGEKIDVERGRFNSLKLYEVAEHELILIEKGSDSSLWLNFAIASISIFCSFLSALLSLDYKDHEKVFTVFMVICVVAAFATVLCGTFWLKTKKTQKDVFQTIRNRMKNYHN